MMRNICLLLSLLFGIANAQGSWTIELKEPSSPLNSDPFTPQETNVDGADSCNISEVSTTTVQFAENFSSVYDVKYVSGVYWYGTERNGLGSASLSASTFNGMCYLIGWAKTSNGALINVIKTREDSSVWAEIGVMPEEDDANDDDLYPPYEEEPALSEPTGDDSSGQVIDVMVPYTREAMCQTASQLPNCETTDFTENAIRQQVNMFIAESDMVYMNSRLDLSLRLVHTYMTNFVEDTDDVARTFLATPNEMKRGENGFELLPGLRDDFCADIAVLITAKGDRYLNDVGESRITYGIACGIGPSTEFWTAISSLEPTAVSGYTFTHEVGHVQGCRHEIARDSDPPMYAHGFIAGDMSYSSIMTTRFTCGGSCMREPIFSTPDFQFNGRVIGNAQNADNQRRIEETKAMIAVFRDSAQCVAPTDPPTGSPSASPSSSPSASPSALPTATPSASPSALPSASPSASPSSTPSASPSDSPSMSPTSPDCGDFPCGGGKGGKGYATDMRLVCSSVSLSHRNGKKGYTSGKKGKGKGGYWNGKGKGDWGTSGWPMTQCVSRKKVQAIFYKDKNAFCGPCPEQDGNVWW